MTALLLLGLLACGDDTNQLRDTGAPTGAPDMIECSDTTTTLASGELSPLGFSADEVLARIAGPVDAAGTWTDTSTAVTVTLAAAAAGDAVFHLREPVGDTGASEDTGFATGAPDDACQDWLEIPLTLTLVTDDGAFDEVVSASVLAMDTASLWASAELDWTALGGSYTFTEIDPSEWDEVGLSVSAGWAEGVPTGQVDMSASREVSASLSEGMVGPVLRW